MLLDIHHRTRHVYPCPASDSHNELRLQPIDDSQQELVDFQIRVEPESRIFHYDLPWGRVHHFHAREPHQCLTVEARARVRTKLDDPYQGLRIHSDASVAPPAKVRSAYCEWLMPSARIPVHDPACADQLDRLGAEAANGQDSGGTLGFAIAVMRHIHGDWTYDTNATHVATTVPELLTGPRRGVCQDFAHLMLGVCRRRGIPARYVSGYLYTGRGLHSGDVMHAWVECLVETEDGGWVWRGFDPTNNLLAGKSYVKVHYGRDFGDVSPTRGLYMGLAADSLEVGVKVSAIEV
jgi:transglutaminase-like putative cysteine protease